MSDVLFYLMLSQIEERYQETYWKVKKLIVTKRSKPRQFITEQTLSQILSIKDDCIAIVLLQ